MKREEKIICNGYGFTVYKRGGRYYIDEHKEIIHSWDTLKGIAEHCYYMGYIPTKSPKHLKTV